MRNLVAAMTKHGVKRIVNLGAWAAGKTAHLTPVWQRAIAWLVLGRVFADKVRGEAILYGSPLEYVNVAPGRLLNEPARGGVKASLDGAGLKMVMTRADLAAWMVEQLTSDEWARTTPIIGY